MMLVMIGSMLLGFYLLVKPITRMAKTKSAERVLLFTKLKQLYLFIWFISFIALSLYGNVITGLPADIARSYHDVILVVGFGGIIFRNVDVLEQTAAEIRLLSFDPDASEPVTNAEPSD